MVNSNSLHFSLFAVLQIEVGVGVGVPGIYTSSIDTHQECPE